MTNVVDVPNLVWTMFQCNEKSETHDTTTHTTAQPPRSKQTQKYPTKTKIYMIEGRLFEVTRVVSGLTTGKHSNSPQ